MTVFAGLDPKIISSTDIRYREGRPDVRQYDFCYYIIQSEDYPDWDDMNGTDILENYMIEVELVKSTEMNVYVYSGNTSLTIEVGEKVQRNKTENLMVIAIPNKDMDTEF